MSDARAAETLALRVLEQWCLIGEEPMEGERWETMCLLAGADPSTTAEGATYLRSLMSLEERQARLKQLNYARQIEHSFKRRESDAA